MKPMKYLLIAFGILVLICGFGLIIAETTLPAGRKFENEVEINASADKVWEVIADKKRYTEWQTQLEKVEIIDDKNWVEYPKGSPEPLRFMTASDERPARMEFHYTMGPSFSGHWKGELAPTANGVKLKTTDSYQTSGIFSKIMIYMFFDMGTFARDWNAKLKRRVENLR